ncbi:MAG: dephospho-CoA kinase [Syntrophomonadaceae bacterium]|nr:dephospho-CoA kinase [Syntrophomonadaceae bacterium]
MKIIGLTGGIASGKSTVSKFLAELGAIIIDGDETAHRLMEPNQPIWEDVVNAFGREVLNPDSTIDRIKLGAIVFNDREKLQVLNQIAHPRILAEIQNELQHLRHTQPDSVLVLDIPLLFEGRMDRLCDQVWVVWVPREIQIERLMERNWLSREEAVKRIDSQMSLDAKARLADIVIDNSGTMEETMIQVVKYYGAIAGQPMST